MDRTEMMRKETLFGYEILITPYFCAWYSHCIYFINTAGSVSLERMDSDGGWVITNVFVDEQARHRGLATTLIDRALCEAIRRNIKEVWLWCTEGNIPFYERFGFKDTGEFTIDKCNGKVMHYMKWVV